MEPLLLFLFICSLTMAFAITIGVSLFLDWLQERQKTETSHLKI